MADQKPILLGYFRFVISDEPGVVGKVISSNCEGYAVYSDIPVYVYPGRTKGSIALTKED